MAKCPTQVTPVLLLAALLLGWSNSASGQPRSPGSARAQQSADCRTGAFQSRSGDLLAISTPATGGFRYTFVDGRRGLTSDAASPVSCAGDALLVRAPNGRNERWTKVALRITPTRFDSAGVTLSGMLIEPPGPGPHPLVVMAHGSENFGWLPSTQGPPFLYAAMGVSTFIFDKHGTGSSGGVFHMNFRRLADDLVAASAEARRLARGRYSRFGIHGGSQGGWTAPLAIAAARADFMIVSFGGVFSPQEEDAEQVLDDLRTAGFGEDVLERAREITRATGRVMSSEFREGHEELARVRAAYEREPWFSKIRGEYSGRMLRAGPQELTSARNNSQIDWLHDSVVVLRERLNVPTLWILAEKDREAPGRLTEDRLRMLVSEGKPIQVVVFPDTDHGMVEFEEQPDGTRRVTRVTEGYYRLVADWVLGRVRQPYGRAQFWPQPQSQSAPAMVSQGGERSAIEAVLRNYLSGFRDGNRAAFDAIFASGSVHVLQNRDQPNAVTITPIDQRLPGWSASPDAAARLENVSISFQGDRLALASFTLHYRGNVFHDQLNLYRFADGWKVGAKVTAIPPRAR